MVDSDTPVTLAMNALSGLPSGGISEHRKKMAAAATEIGLFPATTPSSVAVDATWAAARASLSVSANLLQNLSI